MSSSDPKSPLDPLVRAAVSLGLAATALYIAVRLIEAVWVGLLVIGLIAAAVAALVYVVRGRREW